MELCGLALRYGLAVLIARLGGAEGLGLYVLAIAFARGASLIGRLGMDRRGFGRGGTVAGKDA